ncbi:MAG: thioredoxin domain-containing protein [Alphaproteobacteria bacterium]|nr:thioredoxin domain-containing protein [Alphaproteobacteria bacterium]
MQIDVISDTVCPWCYIGKRRLERAMKLRPQIQFDVRWRPFQLDPTTPAEGVERRAYIERKFGSTDKVKPIHNALLQAGQAEGIAFAFEKITRAPNTINSHRLIRWSHSAGVQDAVVEGLFRAYFIDGADVGDIKTLAQIGAEAGMDAELVEELLNSDADREKVEHEDSMARKIGINGVPTYLVGGKVLVTGAQDAEHLVHVIDRVAAELEPAQARA